MNTPRQYNNFLKPSWAPPSWLFGPVWTVLYIIIAISYGYAVYMYTTGAIGFLVLLPFILNIIFNVIYTPIQFGLKNNLLASIDILLVLGTLAWTLLAIYPHAAWITWVNIPYFLWVSFATVLQLTITVMNRKNVK